MKKLFVLIMLFVFLFSTAAMAATVTLRWNRNNEPDLAKYTAFWRLPSGEYIRNAEAPFFHEDVTVLIVDSTDDLQHPREVVITALGNEWEFVVTASDDSGNESGYSNQVDIITPQPPGGLTIWEVIYAALKSVWDWFFA